MYAFHNQPNYRKENLQNADNFELYKETEEGEKPGTYRKWVLQRMEEPQKEMFMKVRAALVEKGLHHVSDN